MWSRRLTGPLGARPLPWRASERFSLARALARRHGHTLTPPPSIFDITGVSIGRKTSPWSVLVHGLIRLHHSLRLIILNSLGACCFLLHYRPPLPSTTFPYFFMLATWCRHFGSRVQKYRLKPRTLKLNWRCCSVGGMGSSVCFLSPQSPKKF
jgi:hypothetical protein